MDAKVFGLIFASSCIFSGEKTRFLGFFAHVDNFVSVDRANYIG